MARPKFIEKPPAFQFYANDWLGSKAVRLMTPAQRGFYIQLLAEAWQSDSPGYLPAKYRPWQLAGSKNEEEFMRDGGEFVLQQFQEDEGGTFNPRLVKERMSQIKFRKLQSIKGKAGAHQRWHRPSSGHSTGIAGAIPDHSSSSSSSSSISSSSFQEEERSVSGKKSRKSKTPAIVFAVPEWVPKDSWKAYIEMRNRIHKPMTENAKVLAVGVLEKLKTQGNEVRAVLNQSVFNSWQGLFPLRSLESSSNGAAASNEELDRLVEEEKTKLKARENARKKLTIPTVVNSWLKMFDFQWSKKADADVQRCWIQIFAGADPENLNEAMKQAWENCDYYPTPDQVREGLMPPKREGIAWIPPHGGECLANEYAGQRLSDGRELRCACRTCRPDLGWCRWKYEDESFCKRLSKKRNPYCAFHHHRASDHFEIFTLDVKQQLEYLRDLDRQGLLIFTSDEPSPEVRGADLGPCSNWLEFKACLRKLTGQVTMSK